MQPLNKNSECPDRSGSPLTIESVANSEPHRTTTTVLMQIDGMDCASCVGKIDTALQRLPGVSHIRLNLTTQKLELTLEPGSTTQASDIEAHIKRLGFRVRTDSSPNPLDTCSQAVSTGRRWWHTRKGRQVLGVGALMALAYSVAWLFPSYRTVAFSTAVIAGVLPFVRTSWSLAQSGSPFSIEVLMSVAAIGALLIGEAEEAMAVIFLFSVGELLESVAAGRARAGINALASLVPTKAILLDAKGGQREVAAADLRVGELIQVRPGDKVAADGVILQGESSLDESPITGESIPLAKNIGDAVYAGSVNVEGVLQVRVGKTAADNTISRIIHLVEEAQAAKAPTARFIETFSRYYTPAVMLVAALTMAVPPLTMGADWQTWLYRGLALLLIACPCALVLSTPAAIASGLAAGTRRGLLLKGGAALETIGQVKVIAFDKTGTLTPGKPRVTDIIAFGKMTKNQILTLAASVESGSSHPLAKAIVSQAVSAGMPIPAASRASATAGSAVHATVAGRALAISSVRYAAKIVTLSAAQNEQITTLQREGKTVSILFDEKTREGLGLLALRDEPRQDAQTAISRLKTMGIRPLMLTGDNRLAAQAIAHDLGLDYKAELLPQDKLKQINEIKSSHKVAMVGDGINDAPALAAADVGIAMGGGTAVALETADAALLKQRVTDVVHLVALSRATMANIQQNVVFALGLKLVFLITTVLGITGLWVAVLADTGATAIVTLNALRLLRFKGDRPDKAAASPSGTA